MARREKAPYVPNPEQMALWPELSGNTVNGLGEEAPRRPSPIYWHAPDATPHGRLQNYFYARNANAPGAAEARARRQAILDAPVPELAPERVERSAEEWSAAVKAVAREGGADIVGIAPFRTDYVFEGMAVPDWQWMVMIGVAMDHGTMMTAPSGQALNEIVEQYGRGTQAAKHLAGWLRQQGWDALGHGGPGAGPVVLIPAAIEAGLGELGKHGSLINDELGSCFRLAVTFTNVPLLPDRPADMAVDDFCTGCRLCSEACPPDAIFQEKQQVRGVEKWYVDFDKCLPYFNDEMSCGICLAVCPWSRPGVGPRLLAKMARRRAAATGGETPS